MRRFAKQWCACLTMLILAIATATAQEGPRCSARPGDETAVVATLRSMFDAAQADDLNKFHAIAAPDFYAYDNGKRFDGDALMQLIKNYHGQGYAFVWTVTEPQVHANCDVAWATYVNRGSIKDASGTTTPMSWLESAVLLRDGDGWKVRFLHSTRVPQ